MKTDNDLFREWDLYERIDRSNCMKQREIAESTRDALRRRTEPLRVLDLGCGDGAMSHNVLSKSHVTHYIGVDLSESALERLGRREPPGTHPAEVERSLLHGDIQDEIRTLPDGRFDLVHASYSLHHFQAEAKPRLFDEIARVLDSGGWLIWTDVVRIEGESRDEYLHRLAADIQSNWQAISADERRSVVEHVRACDFPEHLSWMIEQVEDRGLQFVGRLFEDFFYTSLLFSKRDARYESRRIG